MDDKERMKPDDVPFDWIETIVSAWKGHRRFAMWLVKYLKPEEIVDLGVDYGYSTFTWQHALMKYQQKGMVTGIDLFQGDPQTGARNTFDFVKKKILDEALTSIDIVVGDFQEVSETWSRDRKVDIIHIDGYHSKEAVTKDFNNWFHWLRDDGVMLFHDVNVQHPGFGVEEFFNELQVPEYQKLKFLHSAGLGILTKNKVLYQHILTEFSGLNGVMRL